MIFQIINFPQYGNFNGPSNFKFPNSSPGDIITAIIPLILVAAGFILLVMLIISGYQFMVSRGDPKALEGAKGRLLFSLIGFFIVFAAYWLMIIIQTLLHMEVVQ